MCSVCRMERTHAVCTPCRYAVKRWMWNLGRCPNCRGDLVDMGVKFKTPKKRDVAAWNKLVGRGRANP